MIHRLDPTEIKILLISITAPIVFDMDLLMRFLAPLLSALVWFYLKPKLIELRGKYRRKKKLDKNNEQD